MDDPVFVSLDEAVRIQQDQLVRYGGCEGIRDSGLLQSALAMPQAGFADRYAHEDVFAMAAAYLFHIVQNHPFVDGSKRPGIAVALVFDLLSEPGATEAICRADADVDAGLGYSTADVRAKYIDE